MSRAEDILSIRFDVDTYIRSADTVIDKFIKRTIEHRKIELDNITNTLDSTESEIDKSLDIDDIINQLRNGYKNETFRPSRRILSTLCFHLHRINDIDCLRYVFSLFDEDWSNRYINGLIDYVFRFWNPNDKVFGLIIDYLLRKLRIYVGSNSKLQFFKTNTIYLQDGAPEKLGVSLKVKKESVMSCLSLFNMSKDKFSYKYFDELIYSYYSYKADKGVDYDELSDVLEKHNNLYTDKIVLSYLITKRNVSTEKERDRLVFLSKNRIGDSGNDSKWSFPYYVDEVKRERLKQAQNTIRIWTNERLINVYFELCVDDPRRKAFWLHYVEYIESIRIVGSLMIKDTLLNDSRVSSLMKNSFISLKSKCVLTSAFIMKIKGQIFVEFSDVGALYVYNAKECPVRNIWSIQIVDSINDLKRPYMSNLSDAGFYMEDTGRLVHQGYWESRLTSWLQNVMKIYLY